MKLNTYLSFDGQCEEAFTFYQKVLGGEIPMMMKYSDAPGSESMPGVALGKIMHTRLLIGDNVLMGSDAPDGSSKPAGFNVSIAIDDITEGERIFNALAEGGNVYMPYEKTFWAERFGMVTDRFGIPWMVNAGEGM